MPIHATPCVSHQRAIVLSCPLRKDSVGGAPCGAPDAPTFGTENSQQPLRDPQRQGVRTRERSANGLTERHVTGVSHLLKPRDPALRAFVTDGVDNSQSKSLIVQVRGEFTSGVPKLARLKLNAQPGRVLKKSLCRRRNFLESHGLIKGGGG